jgi:DNA-directed RNA polymerase specialized sigma24 family protein
MGPLRGSAEPDAGIRDEEREDTNMIAGRNELHFLNNSNDRDAIWRAIVSALSGFSSQQHRVFVMYHYTGSSIASIAEITGLSESKVLELIDQTNRMLVSKLRSFRMENDNSISEIISGAKLAAC